MKVAKHKINAKKTKHFVYGKHTKKVPIMRTVFTRIVNIVLRASLLCAVFVLGGLNKGFAESNQCLVLKHQSFGLKHETFADGNKSLVLKHQGLVDSHRSFALKHQAFADSRKCLVLKHQRFVERHKGFCETNKYLFYKNKSPP